LNIGFLWWIKFDRDASLAPTGEDEVIGTPDPAPFSLLHASHLPIVSNSQRFPLRLVFDRE